jgi:hypothetical protein
MIGLKSHQNQILVCTAAKWLAEKTKESPKDGIQELPEV